MEKFARGKIELSPVQLVAMISSPALFIDQQAEVVSVNVAMNNLLNVDDAALLGRAVSELVVKSDREKIQDYLTSAQNYKSVKTDFKPLEVRSSLYSKPLCMTPIFHPQYALLGFLVQAHGPALVEENLLWQNSVKTGRLGVWERIDPPGTVVTSSSWWQVRGYEADEHPKYDRQEWLTRIHPEDRHIIETPLEQLCDESTGFVESRYREKNKQGDYIWILSRIQIVRRNNQGQVLYMAGVDTDITDLVAAEEQRAELAEQLSHAERLKSIGQLTGGIAHDFNNLLAIISGSAELLKQHLGSNTEELNDISKAVDRGAGLTSSILSFSRKQPLQPSTIDVTQLMDNLVGMLRRTFEEHIELQVVIESDIWNCTADNSQIENALINLAMNARDALATGGVLGISAGNIVLSEKDALVYGELQPGEYVLFTVSDTGVGMTEQELCRAFEPFFTTKSLGQGTGLGLTRVFGFAKQSNGHVGIESQLNQGTVVQLFLPRSKENAYPDSSTATLELLRKSEAPRNIMLVEDDHVIRSINTRFLQNNGYHVQAFETADEALASFLQNDNVDLLLTDLVLPGKLNGAQLGAEMRALKPELKVIFISGYSDHSKFGQKINELSEGFLQKPFELRVLAKKMDSLLNPIVNGH